MWDRISVKQRGKAAFQRNYWTCVLAALILALCIGGNAGRSAVNTSQEYLEDDPYEYQYSYAQPGNGSIISTALIGGGISGILIKVLLIKSHQHQPRLRLLAVQPAESLYQFVDTLVTHDSTDE